jgi:hypothetical protein
MSRDCTEAGFDAAGLFSAWFAWFSVFLPMPKGHAT